MLSGKILITGGAGTLGREIIRRATENQWDCDITILSTDAVKHFYVKSLWPQVHSVIGDIRDSTTVYNAMAGKDIVIHAAAVKHIPDSEWNSIDTFQINVEGSLNICNAALQHGTPHVLGISTDKVCHPANAYGATKYLMEKTFQEFSRLGLPTQFHLVRYGNVLESTASVIEVWKKAVLEGKPIKVTDPRMTRFYISPKQAVDLVVAAMELESGNILIPKMKSLSVAKLAEYTLEEYEVQEVPIRPGEKMHETLLTIEECRNVLPKDGSFILHPTTSGFVNPYHIGMSPYTSENAEELTREELATLLANE